MVFESTTYSRAKKNNYCGSQRSRFVLIICFYWPSNTGRLHKWNTLSKPPNHRTYRNCNAYFMSLQTWDTYLAVWDYHTDVNWHLGNTWILWLFLKSWTNEILWYWPPSFAPCIILAIIYHGLVFLLIRSHVGVICIFVVGWIVLEHLIGKILWNFQNSTILLSFHVW